MDENRSSKKYGFIAFVPLLVFLALYIGFGLFFTAQGVPKAFKQFPRHVALLIGIFIAFLMNRKEKFGTKVDVFSKNAGNEG